MYGIMCSFARMHARTQKNKLPKGEKIRWAWKQHIRNNMRKRLNTVNMTANSKAREKQRQNPSIKQLKLFD